MATDESIKRVERARERAFIKRISYANQIDSIHTLSLRSIEDSELGPQLFVLADKIDEFWSAFNVEDDSWLDHLIELDLSNTYSDKLKLEVLEKLSFIKATVSRLRECAPYSTATSEHGVSRELLHEPVVEIRESESRQVLHGRESSGDTESRHASVQSTVAGSAQHNGVTSIKPTRLPEIPLPNFQGDIYSWVSFRDRFASMVDQRTNLSNIDKFYYLVGCCKGDALDSIRGIPISDANYQLAWTTLETRFDKPRVVAFSLVEKLLTAPRSSTETLAELNKFLLVFDEGVSVLKSMKIPDLGDFMLFSLASRCLPTYSIKLFEAQLSNSFPTAKELIAFIKSRVAVLECIPRELSTKSTITHKSIKTSPYHSVQKLPRHMSMVASNAAPQQPPSCKCCKGTHVLSSCSKFKDWTPDVRNSWARDQRICFRCLQSGHWVSKCKSSIVCSQCTRKHHTLLHPPGSGRPRDERTQNEASSTTNATSSLLGQGTSPSVILGTALIHMTDSLGVLHTVRALIDSASQISAITLDCTNRLGLKVRKWTVPVSGLGGVSVQNVLGIVQCRAQPRFSPDPVFKFDAWVFPSITSDMPRQPLSHSLADKYQHLALADPSFTKPGTIDVLLGADLFAQILNGRRVSVGDGLPVAFGTVFGWTIIGSVPNSRLNISCPITLTTSVETLLERFWAIEEPDAAPEEFTQDGQCEAMFRKGCVRDESGRFSVPLLFRQPVTATTFRGSRSVAEKRFDQLEKRLTNDSRLKTLYCDFMAEYLSLGHMSPATSPGSYFIPHHAVYRASDMDSKIRVVFDASARSYSGESLNHRLLAGPKLQRDVVDVLTLYRVHRYTFTADVSKMYRQISVNSDHRTYQHILWRPSPDDELKAYELNTVTYGVNCSPYLALRVLQYIAEHDCSDFPPVQEALLYNTYVDDICVGEDTIEEVISLQRNLVDVLRGAGMELKKWASNTNEVLENVLPEDRASGLASFDDSTAFGTKVLGLQWSPIEDVFTYTFLHEQLVTTKRGMLSLIARMFDPLGLLSPVIFFAKQLMQRVWLAGISWDEQLPTEIAQLWRSFVEDLPNLQLVKIPRFIGTRRHVHCSLCGFADASTLGYAAVVYLRLIGSSGRPFISLLGAKTKMAPLKASTIPRLELCAALVLAKWMSRLKNTLSLKLQVTDIYGWTDSTTVLNWLTVPHESFKIFVSNRISKIQSLLPDCQWKYIASNQNPADCSSRGLMPSDFIKHDLYLKGPDVLYSTKEGWDVHVPVIPVDQLPEAKTVIPSALPIQENESEWYARFSSYVHMIRVTARMRRFIAGCRRASRPLGFLSRHELDQAALTIARSSQYHLFRKLCHELSHGRPISGKPLARLRPFIDEQGLIRVGGRLSRSSLPESQKHQILLAKTSHFSLLLIRHWHDVTGHSGPQVISVLVCRMFWILSMRSLIRTVISRCTKCVRFTAVNPQPVMADLPASRVTESHPFMRVGVDYAGPFSMKENRLRKARHYKVYVAVFVCFTVRAVHLELVSDLTTDAFIAALNRFVARRGLPTDIYSDCGTNFVGTANHLRDLVNDPNCRDQLTASTHCTWHFNPPGAPHFGGLWEAAVRSMKTLMVRIMGEHVFIVEEFHTVLCRVEAIMNSRPLTPASSDPADTECLTPGHFLIGRPLLAVPEVGIPETSRSLVQRWKLVHQCAQAFWRRWSHEYLQTLQTRSKWVKDRPNIAVNDMVIIKDAQTAPLKWRMGRIIEVFPGSDNITRVVRLQTSTGILTRPVVKIVKLPTDP